MRKIKIIYADAEYIQANIDEWLEDNPTFEIYSTSISSVGDYGTSIISIVYEGKKTEGIEL